MAITAPLFYYRGVKAKLNIFLMCVYVCNCQVIMLVIHQRSFEGQELGPYILIAIVYHSSRCYARYYTMLLMHHDTTRYMLEKKFCLY
jgi:hypothetical protein